MNFSILLEGPNPKLKDQIISYTSGFLVACLVLITARIQGLNWSIIQSLIAFLIIADLVGGVSANLTKSVNTFYHNSTKLSITFLLVHFIQPLLLVIFFGTNWLSFWFLYIIMLITSLIIRFLTKLEYQKQVAAACVVISTIIFSLFFTLPSGFSWFPFIYFFKLTYGFAVQHYSGKQLTDF